MNMTVIFLDFTQIVRKVCNNPDFSQKQYFAGYVFKVSAWLSNHTVCKIGLKKHKNIFQHITDTNVLTFLAR